MADFGDRGDVAKKPEIVDLPLLLRRRRIVEGGLGCPAQLLLDVLDEALDRGRCRFGLFALDPDERRLRFLVGKVEFNRATYQEHATDQEKKDDDVLPEKSAPPASILHRCSLSARSNTFRGTVSPRRFAVFRFTARSILSAPSTGRSCGRAPRRIFATNRAA